MNFDGDVCRNKAFFTDDENGIWSLGDATYKITNGKLNILCDIYGVDKLTAGNRDNTNFDLKDKISGLIFYLFMWLMFIVQVKYYNDYILINKSVHKTPASYSMYINGLPKDKSADEIKKF